MKLRSMIMAGALLSVPQVATAGGAVCLVADPIWRAGHTSSQTTITTGIDAMVATFAANSTLTTQQIVSAIKVLAQQTSAGANTEAVGSQQAMKAAAETYVEQRTAEELLEAHNTYGPPGQAVGSCDFVRDIEVMNTALDAVEERASEIVMSGGLDTRPGSTIDLDTALSRRSYVASTDFDNVVSAVAFVDPGTSAAVKDTFMNNVIGMPVEKPTDLDGVEDSIQFMRARQAEALRSPAIASLASVRAYYEAPGHFGGGGVSGAVNRSLDETIDWLVDRYGGGDEYEQWMAELVTKSETGLLKELARLRAINLALTTERNQSSDRQQAVLATLLATEVGE
ncbi:hypothetical protein SAMN04488527_1478 [Aliiroseovarius crassostreae]|nr:MULTISPECIES: hypothetical protein [Rhodobacterales]UTS82779.1 hypothetical protein OL67_003889 [Phaeobacter piscinae]SFU94485.1 hypothetical protein SAMN04488527_1478 [Aliiroseovarius crassostreae]